MTSGVSWGQLIKPRLERVYKRDETAQYYSPDLLTDC